MRCGMLIMAVTMLAGAVPARAGLDLPEKGLWRIELERFWGVHAKKKTDRNLVLLAASDGLVWERVVGLGLRFNQSAHAATAQLQRDGDRLTGSLMVRVTPDTWMPPGRAQLEVPVEVDARLSAGPDGSVQVDGSFTAQHGTGPMTGRLTGTIRPLAGRPVDGTWWFQGFPVVTPEKQDRPSIQVLAQVVDGAVTRVTLGRLWRRVDHRPMVVREHDLQVDGAGVVGRLTVPAGVLEPTITDPGRSVTLAVSMMADQLVAGGHALVVDGDATGLPAAYHGIGQFNSAQEQPVHMFAPGSPQIWRLAPRAEPWFTRVERFVAPVAGEHPRLLLRRSEVPALRARAATPEGEAMVARLRELLGGGDALPTMFNPTPPADRNTSPKDQPVGRTFTSWHAAGYAMLYQVTGEQRYADLARQAVELMLDGRPDRDNRYCWSLPGNPFRAGALVRGMALAYDLAYDGWDEPFRRKIALLLQDFELPTSAGKVASHALNAGRTGYPPGSNHYGGFLAAATGLLAVLDDPGTDPVKCRALLDDYRRAMVYQFSDGFGDRAFHPEGHHPSRISANLGVVPLLAAWRRVLGEDWITPNPGVSWVTLRWIFEVAPGADGPLFPRRGDYGGDRLDSAGISHDGDFSQGFAAIPPRYRPALLWTWRRFVQPHHDNFGAGEYPHFAVAALANWPIDLEPVNPAKVMPRVVYDTVHGYVAARNRWQDEHDIVVTTLSNTGPKGYKSLKRNGVLVLTGGQLRHLNVRIGRPRSFAGAEDGSFALVGTSTYQLAGQVNGLFCDFSKAAGVDLLLVGAGPRFEDLDKPMAGMTRVTAGGRSYVLMTVPAEAASAAVAEGEAVRLGGQTVRFDGQRWHAGVFEPSEVVEPGPED